jgi:hypothetical protein
LRLLFKKSTPLHKRLVKQSKIAAIVRCSGLNLELYVLLMAADRTGYLRQPFFGTAAKMLFAQNMPQID